MATPDRDPPFEGGSQPVPHHSEPVPGPGRSFGQILVVIVAVIAVAAAVVWFIK